MWLTLNLGRMVQPDLRATLTGQQRVPIEAMAPMGPMELARTVAPGREGIARFPILICRRDGREQPSGTQACRLIANCGTLAFGMDAKHAARNFRFQLEARERLRRDPLVSSSALPALIVKSIAMVVLGRREIVATVRLVRLEVSAMEIEGPKALIAAMIAQLIVQADLTVNKGSRALPNQLNQLNRR